MKNLIIVSSILFSIISCKQNPESYENIDWQGHRGARGVYPENTWAAFQYALEQNMNTLEMDVVISKDGKVVLSHEPFLNHKICLDTAGNPIPEAEEKEWNIYKMNYSDLQKCDCGTIQNPDFPNQKTASSSKPLLIDIINKTKSYCGEKGIELPHMNVEVKYEEEMKGEFHPEIKEFNKLVYNVLSANYPLEKWNIQSFDFNVLKHFHENYPKVTLAALVFESGAYEQQFEDLGFTPEIYSPYFQLVDNKMLTDLHEQNVKVIPWTVNEEKDAKRLIKLGIDGIITDYPELADKFRKNP